MPSAVILGRVGSAATSLQLVARLTHAAPAQRAELPAQGETSG
jgi:hypothetical protein